MTAAALALAQAPLHALMASDARAQIVTGANIMTRADYEACQSRDDEGFKRAIEELTFKGLQVGLRGIDYRAVVLEEWRRIGLDDIIDKQVDLAVAEVRDETSWTALIKSIASEEQAKALAETVAKRVYESKAVQGGIEGLAVGVGQALGKRIETATAETAEPAVQCMQAFLGIRYGRTVANTFSKDARKEYQIDPTRAGADVSTSSVIAGGAGGITGAIILIVRRQLQTMASRVGTRIVGAVMSRVVGAVAGGIGLVLIAKDIWEFRNGVLPIIAGEMKSRSTKDKVIDELSRAMQEQISDNTREIARGTANRVVDIWHEFKRAHAKVLALAETNASFKTFLDSLKPDALGRLDEVIGLLSQSEGDSAILRRLDNGTLNEAVNRMPAAGMDIARDARSIDEALQWWAVAGDAMPSVLEHELHKRSKAEAFTRAGLQRVLAVGDRVTMQRLAGLPPASRDVLLDLDHADVRTLGRALSEAELASLSGYMTSLEKPSAQRMLRSVAQSPAKMQVLAKASVRDAILASKDQALAVAMMLRSDTVPDPFMAYEHARYVFDGKVSPILLWQKHPVFLVGSLLAGLIVLAMLKRLLFGRRQRVILQRVEVPAPAPQPRAGNAPPIRTADKK